jgi:hypothetical protein
MANWTRMCRRCSLVLSLLLAAGHPSTSHAREQQKPESTLRTAVRSAKAQGKSSISVPVMFEFATAGDPAVQLKGVSVVRAKAIKLRALLTVEPLVYNWHVLQVVSWLSRTNSTECEASRPRELPLEPSQIALRTVGGTATVEGVSVTIEAPQFDIPWRAWKQGRFWEMHDRLFAQGRQLNDSSWPMLAGELKLDAGMFSRCLDTEGPAAVRGDLQMAQDLQLSGTPTFLIGAVDADGLVKISHRLSGAQPIDQFKRALDPLFAESRTN